MRMGLPQVLSTDQSSEFVNQLNDELMKKLGIDHRLTTPHHPQVNGLDERWNQTLQNMLVKFAEEKKELWDSYLDTCVFAYNTSQHESTHFTPFELMFGRKAVLPIDVEMRKNTAEDALALCHDDLGDLADDMDKLMENRYNMLIEAKANIKKAQGRQKEQYDRKHACSDAFQRGAKVLMKDLRRKKRKGESWMLNGWVSTPSPRI